MKPKREPRRETPSVKLKLDELRESLSAKQLELLDLFWNHYLSEGKWPVARVIHSRHGGRPSVRAALDVLENDVLLQAQDANGVPNYQLTIIGILLTKEGEVYRNLLLRYLGYLRERFHLEPQRLDFSDEDFATALKLSEDQRKTMGTLVEQSRFWRGFRPSMDHWSVTAPDEAEDLPDGPLDSVLDHLLFRGFRAARRPLSLATPSIGLEEYFGSSLAVPALAAQPIVVDALKRRYQVFVSSTYEDLKEERQHVIQALLETKCIPIGMELFPAASMEQWELIRRVIRECDYYIVVVAGRYGSLGPASIGYTEMEYDYAQEIGMPVIGFYHKNIDALPGSKLEKSDAGKELLNAFTDKVKTKLCRGWASATELGSAVKSAIIHELEFNPRPGWVKADEMPTSATVDKLKQRVADLEEQLKKRKIANGRSSARVNLQVKADLTIVHTDRLAVVLTIAAVNCGGTPVYVKRVAAILPKDDGFMPAGLSPERHAEVKKLVQENLVAAEMNIFGARDEQPIEVRPHGGQKVWRCEIPKGQRFLAEKKGDDEIGKAYVELTSGKKIFCDFVLISDEQWPPL